MAPPTHYFTILALIVIGVSGTPARKSKVIDDYEYTDYGNSDGPKAVTCPGFPGYCSETYVGDTCTVVCSRGRNNVPQCQEDGTWTDIPRCIEHEPGIEQQVTGLCPGIPGYCSLDWPGALCEFECPVGPAIRSSCTEDGTWDPYPTCQGDPRETQDGCNPCPGPNGGPRNRTLEANGANGAGRKQGGAAANRNGGGQKKINGGGSQNNRKSPSQNNRNSGGQNNRNFGAHNNRNNGGSQSNGSARNGGNQSSRRGGSQNRIGASGGSKNNGGSSQKSFGGGNQQKESVGQCPGDELQACIDVCPGITARVFGACVAGCAKRCPAKK